MRAIILTAGKGRNLEPLTETRPKPMIHICGESILTRILKSLRAIGITQSDLVIGHLGEKIRQHYSEHPVQNFKIHYIEQAESLGVGDAVCQARNRVSPTEFFLLVYGDILFSPNMFVSLINTFKSVKKSVAAVCLTKNSTDYGNIYMDHEMRINRIIEKPPRTDLGNYVLSGAFILPGTFFHLLDSSQQNMIEALGKLAVDEGMYASIWERNWVDIGYPWDILTANQVIMGDWAESRIASDLKLEAGACIEGPVVIESGVEIKGGARILGPCFIGKNSFIGHNALIRNYTSIGANSVVGFGVEMKNSVLFERTEIGRLSFIGDSVIGEDVNIGSQTVMVNINLDMSSVKVQVGDTLVDSGLTKLGTLVGDKTWIGAGHTLLPGTKISAGSLIQHHSTLHLS